MAETGTPHTLEELERLALSTLRRIDQRRFELLGMTLFVLVAFAVAIGAVALGPQDPSSEFETTMMIVRWSLLPLSLGFAAYLFAKERELRRLTREVHGWETQAAERMRLLFETKDQLLTAVSHQVRTPLTKALGFAQLLDESGEALAPEKRAEMTGRLRESLSELDGMLQDFIDLDRLWRGVVELKTQRTDIEALVREVAGPFGAEVVFAELDGRSVALDPPKVERILESLLSNARRHTPDGTNVWVRVVGEADGITLVVEDDGAGIAREHREEVLRPFGRGNDDRVSPGTGLGLTLVERLARLHGGHVTVGERDGGGTSIRVYLSDGEAEDRARELALRQVRV